MKKKSSFLQRVFSVMTITALLSQQVLPILVYAQSTDNVENVPAMETPTPTEIISETPTPTLTPTPAISITPEENNTDNNVIIIPKIDNGLNLEKYFVPTPTMNLDIVGKLQTFSNIVVNNVYVYALNSDVSVKFTKLPIETNLSFTIEEVSVNLDGKTLTGYDIKSDMVDGEFSYELVLPNTVGKNAEVQFSEDGATFNDVQNEKLTLDTVAVNADHFTIFVVTSSSALYSGTWIHYPTQGYQNGGVDYPTTIPSGQTATWTFSTLPTSTYDVYVSWSTDPNRTTTAPYTLNSVGPIGTTVIINQERLADQATTGGSGQWSGWYKLGTFTLDNTSSLVLTSVDNTSGNDYVIADTVALVDTSVAPSEVWVNGTYSQFGANDYHVWGYDAFTTVQSAVTAVAPISGMVNVAAGTYTEVGQIIINKDLSIVGADKATTIIKPAQDTSSSGDARGWFLVQPANTFNISNVTLDGTGHSIFMGLYYLGDGTVNNINVNNIKYNESSSYEGRGITIKRNVNVTNSTFTQIGRIGVQYFGGSGTVDGNTFTGKGTGNWLDYGVELGNGTVVTISNNTITNNTGVASNDGSTSAGILVTTYFGPGTTATITGNTVTSNTDGIAVGYDSSDTSTVTAHQNNLSGNVVTGITSISTNAVNATNNWWGDASGPLDSKTLPGTPNYNNLSGTGNPVSSYVDYRSWFTDLAMTTLTSANAITIAATDVTSIDATLNGTNGVYDATGHSLWVSLNTFSTASSTIPFGVYSTVDLGSINANIAFSATLSSDFTGFPGVTPGTTYYFAAWSLVGGIWYPGEILTFTTSNGPVFIDTNINGVLDAGEQSFNTIQTAINAATSGNTIHVTAGTYIEVGQIVIDKNLSIVGADKTTTIIKPNFDTSNSGDSKGWFLVTSGTTFNLSNVTLDGSGHNVFQTIRDYGIGTIENCTFTNIKYNASGPDYAGTAIVAFMGSSGNVDVKNSEFNEIGRVGVLYFGDGKTGTYSGNTYIGKGSGNWLDYAVEVGSGASATITGNIISGNTGFATVDGSTSAGIIATTLYGPGSNLKVTNNSIHDNSYGVAIGYGAGDTSSVTQFDTNIFNSNAFDLDNNTLNNVDARNNIWSVADQNNLNQIETKINQNCSNSIYVHGVCSGTDDYNTGGMVQYKDIGTPVNLGWNAASQSGTPNEMPLDLPCTIGSVYTNENSLAQNWSLVNGVNVKYQREVVFPSTAIGYFEAGSNNYTPFSSFGPGTEGLWKTSVRAYLDINNNNQYDSGEEVSAWSNQCQIIFDSTTPVITLLGANPQVIELGNAYVELGATVLDNFDIGLTATINSSTVNTSLLGSYSVTYDAVDSAGNHAVQVTRTVNVVDTTAPAVPSLVSPADGIYRHSAYSNFSDWTGVTDLSGVVYYYQSAFDFGFTNLAYTSGPLTESMILNPGEPEISYFWHVKACDTVGNCSDWSTPWMINIDNTAPNFTITIPTTNQIIMGRLITINGTATDTNFNYYYCYVSNVNGHEYGVRDASCTTTWHAVTPASVLGSVTLPNDLPDGNYVVHLIGYDKAMNSAETTQSLVLDNTAPNANITSPLEGGYVRGTIDITGVFSDNNQEFNGIYMGFIGNDKDGNPLSWCYSEAPGFGIPDGTRTCSFDTTMLSDGSHKIEIWAMDKAGNWGTGSSQSINVMVDNTAPTISIDSVKYGLVYVPTFITNDNNPTFVGTYLGDHLGTINVNLNGIDIPISPTGGTWEADFSAASLSDGTYNITATITDLAGNSSTDTQELVIDTVAPTAIHTYYKNGIAVTTPIAYVQDVSELSFTAQYLDSDPSSGLNTDSYVIFQAQDDHSFGFAANGKLSYCGWRTLPNLVTIPADGALTTPVSFTNCISTLPEGEYYLTHQVYDNATRNDIPSINQYRDVLGLHFIVDRTAPVVTAPDNITVEATSASGANVAFSNTGSATDNVDGSITPTCLPASDSLFPLGSTIVVCSATDNAGNTGTDSFTVTVLAPEITSTPTPTVTNTPTPTVTNTPTPTSTPTGQRVTTTTQSNGIGDAFTPTPTPAPTGIVAGQETTGILGLLDQKCTTKYDASGYAYIDANNNNLKDTGEAVASNVEVIIYLENVLQDDGSTKNIDLVTVKTDASGLWKVNICAGSYKLRVNPNTLPSNTKLVKDSIDLTVKSDQTNENINLALVDNTSGFNWWWLVLPIGAIGILAYFYNGMKDSKVKLPRK